MSVTRTILTPVRTALALLGLLALAAGLRAGDWPHWRGPDRDDVAAEDSGWDQGGWPPGKAVWAGNVGEGSSSPLVAGGRVYATGWKEGRDHVHCLDAATGKEVWVASYRCPKYGRHATGDEGVYSGPTSSPEYDPETGYLYTLGNDGDLHCWDTRAKGRKVWGLNLYDRYGVGRRPAIPLGRGEVRDYGYTTSPLVHGGLVLVEVGARDGTLMAFARKTGERAWASAYRGPAGHSGGMTPITVQGVPCVAVFTLYHLLVVRLDKGKEGKTVAAYGWQSAFANNILTPTVHENHVLISSFHSHHSLCKLKITLRGATKEWEVPYASHVGSPVVSRGRVYLASGQLVCLDWATGEKVWEGGSFGQGGSCIVTADGRLIVSGSQGRLALVEAATRSPGRYKELARVARVFGATTWPHAALADGRLSWKDREGNLKCFRVGHRPDRKPRSR